MPAAGLAPPRTRDDVAVVDGVSLHVGPATRPDDRAGLERMIRYGARPAFAHTRLSITASGKVSYRLKRPWFTGQTHVTLEPVEFLRRLTTLIPPPRVHLTRFHGAFAPRARVRAAVVALAPGAPAAAVADPDDTAADTADADAPAARRARVRWAALLARVFSIDVTRCADPACGGRASIIAWITDPDVIHKLLAHVGIELHPTITPLARPPPPAQLDLVST